MSKNNKKRSSKARIPPDVAAQYFSHLSNSSGGGGGSAGSNNNSGGDGNRGDPPCSPEEVKALMSMFAEIMGMAEKKSSVSFMFGSKNGSPSSGSNNTSSGGENWPPSALAAAARAASMYMPPEDFLDYEDDEDDDEEEDDDEVEDDYEDEDQHTASSDSKRPAIDPSDWKDLEEVARAEKREEELRQKKAAKKREKKQRKKERLRKEASDKANEAAKKKQEKLLTSWKSRVVAACHSHEATKVAALLQESPFKKDEEGISKEHVDFLLSSCVSKTRQDVDGGSDCRLKLTDFVAGVSFHSFLAISHKTGRNLLHAACFIGDHYFVQFVLKYRDGDKEEAKEHINEVCEESGFAPIHYAVLSGSKQVLEILLAHGGCKLDTCTDDDETCLRGEGITALELAQVVLGGEQSDLDTSGSVMSDVNATFLSNVDDRHRYHIFLRFVIARLTDVSKNGYTPPLDAKKEDKEEEEPDSQQSKASRNKKKKKKKKQQQQQQSVTTVPPTPPPIQQEDPMIAALLGMGFSNEQIEAAVKACGGTARATADDLVMWIFAQESGEGVPTPAATETSADPAASQEVTPEPIQESPQEMALRVEREGVEAFQQAEEARVAQQRLTQKREEQRRRNRDWNNREQVRQQQAKMSAVPPPPSMSQPIMGFQGPTPEQATKTRGSKNGTAALNPQAGPVKILSRPKVPPEVSTPAASNVKKHHPPGLETIGTDFSYVGGSSAFAEDATVSSLGSGIVGQNEWMNETDSVANSYVNDAPALAGFQGIATNNVPPPGFQSGLMQLAPEDANGFTESEVLGFMDDPNETGEIRATARAFVPTSFKPPPGLSNGPSNYPVPELSTIGESNSGLNPMASLLPGGLAPYPVGQQHQASLLNGFDRSSLVAPAPTYSPVQSAASSITGVSGADDLMAPPGVGLPSSLGLGAFQTSTPIGSSLLDPLSLGTQSTSQPLWGGVPQASVAGAPPGGLAPLSEGLPSLSAFGGAFGTLEDKNNGAPASGGWGDTTTSSSIW